MYAIQTVPLRTVKYGNTRVKYAQVRDDGKFNFVISLDDATLFNSVPDAIQALGERAQMVRKITNELTITPVDVQAPPPPPPPTRRVAGTPFNGHKVTGR